MELDAATGFNPIPSKSQRNKIIPGSHPGLSSSLPVSLFFPMSGSVRFNSGRWVCWRFVGVVMGGGEENMKGVRGFPFLFQFFFCRFKFGRGWGTAV